MNDNENTQKIIDQPISSELKVAYLNYAMSVIVGRAIPDVRDGLKPVQRRILYSMMDLGLWNNRPYKKSARIVGDTIGKYHPHGDSAVYEALVRMAQDFSLRYPLIQGQGNFGSIDGDAPAAMRYSEAKMQKIAEEMLVDIEKNTVDFSPNYDNSLREPTVLPSKIPNLLINGTSGIAVGMATNIPSHNLVEVCDALIYLIDKPSAQISEITSIIRGPDFPTGAKIINEFEMPKIYEEGRGAIHIRANYHTEDKGKRKQLVFTEIPYKINKSNLVEHIAKLVNEGIIQGISDLRDESDRDGIRLVIELKMDSEPELVANNLFKHTELETSFGLNMLVLNRNKPMLMNIKQVLEAYIEHRVEVTKRWLIFDIDKLKKKLHILEGLMIAINHLDETIEIIKTSKDPSTAKQRLIERFKIDEIQAQAILDLRLQKLTGLELDNLKQDYEETKKQILEFESILNSFEKLMNLIKDEIKYIRDKYGDARRTELINAKMTKNFNFREFVENKKEVVLLTQSNYIKRMDLEEYRVQNRGGRGVRASKEDLVKDFLVVDTHDILYFFTSKGRLFTTDCYNIPEASRNSKGRYINNLLNLEENESVTNIISINELLVKDANEYSVVMVTKKGKIKKMPFEYIKKVRSNGLIVMGLNDGDDLVAVKIMKEDMKVLITSFRGKAILFDLNNIRHLGRTAMGVKAMNLDESEIVSVNVVSEEDQVLFVSKLGYGKKTQVSEFRETNRGGKGVRAMNTQNAGGIKKTLVVRGEEEMIIVTDNGIVIRTSLSNIPLLSRNTKGVRLIKLDDKDYVHDVDLIEKTEESGELDE